MPASLVGLSWLVDLYYDLYDLLSNSWWGGAFRLTITLLGYGYIDDYVIQPFIEWSGLEWVAESLEPLHGYAYAVEFTNWILHDVDYGFAIATLVVPAIKFPIYVYVMQVRPAGVEW